MRLALAAVLAAPATALAAPVTLDFEGGEDLLLDPETPRPVYVEEGFEITVEGNVYTPQEAEAFDYDPDGAGAQAALGLLLDNVPTGIEPEPTAYEISSADGRGFDLLGLTVPSFFTDRVVSYSEVTELGEFSSTTEQLDEIASAFVQIDLTGTRRDGSTVEAGINPLTLGGFTVDLREQGGFFDVLEPELDLADLGLTDIRTLRIELGAPGLPLEDEACDPLNLDRAEGLGGATPDICQGLGNQPEREGQVLAGAFSREFLNFGNSAGIDAVELAPIPVPAGLPLLAGGLGALARLRRRR